MPSRAARPCAHHGCPRLVRGGSRCEVHAVTDEVVRGTAADRGYDATWRKLRKAFLREHPFCASCEANGEFLVQATHVDHIQPHRGDDALRLAWNNLQPLCASHHSSKTDAQDGGFGNARTA